MFKQHSFLYLFAVVVVVVGYIRVSICVVVVVVVVLRSGPPESPDGAPGRHKAGESVTRHRDKRNLSLSLNSTQLTDSGGGKPPPPPPPPPKRAAAPLFFFLHYSNYCADADFISGRRVRGFTPRLLLMGCVTVDFS